MCVCVGGAGGGSTSAHYSLQHEANRSMAHPGSRNHIHPRDPNAVVLVVLGVGSLYCEKARLQLALALLIKSRFPHLIKRMSVYDPVHTITEYRVLAALGCEDIEESERRRRAIHAPTVFYLPHFPFYLADALLANNMTPWRLGWMAVLGNSLTRTGQVSLQRLQSVTSLLQHVFEIPMIPARSIDRFHTAFRMQSWHLFPHREIGIVTQQLAQEWRSESAVSPHCLQRVEGEEHYFRQAMAALAAAIERINSYPGRIRIQWMLYRKCWAQYMS